MHESYNNVHVIPLTKLKKSSNSSVLILGANPYERSMQTAQRHSLITNPNVHFLDEITSVREPVTMTFDFWNTFYKHPALMEEYMQYRHINHI